MLYGNAQFPVSYNRGAQRSPTAETLPLELFRTRGSLGDRVGQIADPAAPPRHVRRYLPSSPARTGRRGCHREAKREGRTHVRKPSAGGATALPSASGHHQPAALRWTRSRHSPSVHLGRTVHRPHNKPAELSNFPYREFLLLPTTLRTLLERPIAVAPTSIGLSPVTA